MRGVFAKGGRVLGAAGLVAAGLVTVAACSETRETACRDDDGDGFGAGCSAGFDCDDIDPNLNVECNVVVPPDCDVRPFQPGCPCLPGDRRACFTGAPDTQDVGVCRGGTTLCRTGGFWGSCDGEVVATPEVCNGVDDDCDEDVDEAVLSPCGGCDAGCDGSVWGADGDVPFTPNGDLVVDSRGRLTLARDAIERASAVWVPSSEDGLVTKIDASTGQVVARYRSGGGQPSRVAVDYLGDAWIANRAFDDQSTVTKIAGDVGRCVDRDGVPGVTTSTGDALPTGEDECVLFTVPVGDVGAVARALAVDGSVGLDGAGGGHVWVGLFEERAVVELDPGTGETLDRVELPGVQPYGAVVDAFGELWVVSRDGLLARIDRGTRPLAAEVIEVPFACFLAYGLDVDARGRLFISGFSCDAVYRYDPETSQWATVSVEESARGVATAGDDVWVAHTAGLLSRLGGDLRVRSVIDLWDLDRMPTESIGVGVDAFDDPWVVSAGGGAAGEGLATRVDGVTGDVTAQVTVGLGPHVQGDLTGSSLQGGFRPSGTTRQVFDGCADGPPTDWRRVHVDLRASGVGTVVVSVRHAADRAGLAAAEWTVAGRLPEDSPPLALDVPEGGVLEVELDLSTPARDGAPRVDRVGVEWACGPLG